MKKGDGEMKRHKETTLAWEKIFRIVQINKVIIRCWDNFSNNSSREYISLKVPFVTRWFFKKAPNREFMKNYCDDLKNFFNFVCCRWYQNNNPGVILHWGGFICDLDWFF